MGDLVRKLGQVKLKLFQSNPDYYIDYYRDKSIKSGYKGELKFKKESSFMIIFVKINS